MLDHFILDEEHHVVPVDLMTWARWFGDGEHRVVEQTETKFHWVSTVFLGIDYGWGQSRLPVVFETMTFARESAIREVFGRLMKLHVEADDVEFGFNRYCSWDDALTGHRAIVGRLQRAEAEALKVAMP